VFAKTRGGSGILHNRLKRKKKIQSGMVILKLGAVTNVTEQSLFAIS
jgi:hypothetical protein